MAKLLSTDGTSKEISPANGKYFTLKELYTLIGCQWVEVVYLNNAAYHEGDEDSDIMIGDEEGRLCDNPIENPEATRIYRESWSPNHNGVTNIVGNIVLCKSKEFN